MRHAVVTCDMAVYDGENADGMMIPQLECNGNGILGPTGNLFYVSKLAVYIWVAGEADDLKSSAVYRLPLENDP